MFSFLSTSLPIFRVFFFLRSNLWINVETPENPYESDQKSFDLKHSSMNSKWCCFCYVFFSPFVRKSLCKSNKFAWINKQKQKIWLCIHLLINMFRTYLELCKFLKLSLNSQLACLDWLNTTGSSEDFTAKLTNEKCLNSLALMKHEQFSGGFNLFRSNFLLLLFCYEFYNDGKTLFHVR